MREPADVASATPVAEAAGHTSDLAKPYTPVVAPTPQADEVIPVFIANQEAQEAGLTAAMLDEPLQEFTAPTLACPACNRPAEDVDLFCLACGEFLAESEAPDTASADTAGVPVCEECGTQVVEFEVFCLSCGAVVA